MLAETKKATNEEVEIEDWLKLEKIDSVKSKNEA